MKNERFTLNLVSIYIIKNVLLNFSTINIFHRYSQINQVVTITILVLLLFNIVLFSCFRLKELLIIIFAGLITAVSSWKSGDLSFFVYFICIVALKNIEFDTILVRIIAIQFISILLILILFKMNIIPERVSERLGIIRHSFGFNHPGHLPTFCLFIFMGATYLIKDRFKLYMFIPMITIMIVLNKLTDGRTSFFCFIIFCTLYVFNRYFDLSKIINFLNVFLPSFFVLLSVYITRFMTRNKIYYELDLLLSGRFSFMNYFYNNYGISILGQKLNIFTTYESELNVGVTTQVLDNLYLGLLIKYGLLFCVIFLLFLFFLERCLYSKKEYTLMIILLVVLVYSLISNIAPLVELNFIFIVGVALFKNNNSFKERHN